MPLASAPTLNAAHLPDDAKAWFEPMRRSLEKFGRDAAAATAAAIQYDDNLELYSASITTPDDWIAVSYQNSWVDFDANLAARYRKDANGVVWVKGRAKSGATSTIFTLPTGYRPPDQLLFAQRGNSIFASVQVDALGVVKQIDGTTADCSFNLSFSAADRRPDISRTSAGGYPVQWVTGVRGVPQNIVCWQATEKTVGAETRSMLPCVWDASTTSDGRTQVNVRSVPALAPLTVYNLVFAVFGR